MIASLARSRLNLRHEAVLDELFFPSRCRLHASKDVAIGNLLYLYLKKEFSKYALTRPVMVPLSSACTQVGQDDH